MTDQPNRWTQVGREIEFQLAANNISYAEFVRLSGISFKTLKRYIAGEPIVRVDKRRQLTEAMHWTPDSIDRILAGGRPQFTLEERFDLFESDADWWIGQIRDRMNMLEQRLTEFGIGIDTEEIHSGREIPGIVWDRLDRMEVSISRLDDLQVQLDDKQDQIDQLTALLEQLGLRTISPDADELPLPDENRAAES